ncbi:MAG: hypothetical protein ACXVEF_04720 [Polyangiales bacterium]
MVRWLLVCASLVFTACGNESTQTPVDRSVAVASTHPSLRMFDVALSSDVMQLSDMQIVALTAARAPLVAAIARLEGARHSYAEALASSLEADKTASETNQATIALAAFDLDKAIDGFVPVERTARKRMYDTLDERQQRALGPWPELAPIKIDLALDRVALEEAMSLGSDDRLKLASRLRAGAALR